MSSSHVPQTSDYSVAWISAIGTEYTIACALLDEEYSPPTDLPGDDSSYIFGRIGHHHVVMACLPLSRIGTSQAARLVADMIHIFPSLKLGLMVGIAGGAPNHENDIRLGDVVVSTPDARKRCGGVFHYAFGRTVQGSAFEPTSFSDKPHQILLSAAAKLKTNYERRGNQITRIVDDVIVKNSPRLDTYRRPPSAVDVLYKPSYLHPDEKIHCARSCPITEQHIVPRSERLFEPEGPKIHYGIIGSADNLMRDATLRDQIAQRDGVLCFEMESAGLMSSELRCLVVRGICDYSDTHKNDDWQPYAAAVAAAYAKDLLSVIGGRQVKKDGEVTTKRFRLSQPKVLQLLSYDNMHDKHNYSIPGMSFSHEWIWSTSFNQWLKTPDNPYWICGKPGSGKSTLMAYLVHHKQTLTRLNDEGTQYKLLHFFYDGRAGDGLANNISGMLRMFLYQLAAQHDQIHDRLEDLLVQDRLKLDTADDLLEITCDALRMSGSRFCLFIDGLDEYEGDSFELMHTCRLLRDRTGVKLCIGSRPEARVSEVFDLFAMILMQDYNKASMHGYAKDQILKASSTKLDIMSVLSDSVQDTVVERAEGIMLWFKMAIDEIIKKYEVGTTEEKIKQIIHDIPQGLSAMYERILGRIPQIYHQEAAFLLFLVQQLHDLNQIIYDLGENQEFSTIVFSATDMDHVWGAYDFVSEKMGSEIGLQQLSNQAVLQARIKLLLAGLIEIYEVDIDKTLTIGTNRIEVRHVHKTFSAFIRKSTWIEDHLHRRVRLNFPDPFWLTFLTEVIMQATKEQIVTPAEIEECKKDTLVCAKMFSSGRETFVSYPITQFARIFSGQRSVLASLISAFGTYGPGGHRSRVEIMVDGAVEWIMSSLKTDFQFPAKWRSRHVLLRTAFINMPDFAYKYEQDGKSSFVSTHPAMKSYLNMIFGFHHLMFDWALQQTILVPMAKSSELDGVMDLAVAATRGLTGYFSDRMFQDTPMAGHERSFVVKAVIAQSFNPLNKEVVFPLVHTLVANGLSMDCRNMCYYLTVSPTLSLARHHASTFERLLPTDLTTLERTLCGCTHDSAKVGLLFHWAQFSCVEEAYDLPLDKLKMGYGALLDFVLKLGIDLNTPCYSGGNVLHAILDSRVKPMDGRKAVPKKAKFLTLIERGINPKLAGPNGTALHYALDLKKRESRWRILPGRSPDQHDLDFIIGYLQFYEANETWPMEFESDKEESDIDDEDYSGFVEDESDFEEGNDGYEHWDTVAQPVLTHVEPSPEAEVEADPSVLSPNSILFAHETKAPEHTVLPLDEGNDSSDDEFFPARASRTVTDSSVIAESTTVPTANIPENAESVGETTQTPSNHSEAIEIIALSEDSVQVQVTQQSPSESQQELTKYDASLDEDVRSSLEQSQAGPSSQAQQFSFASDAATTLGLEQLWEDQASLFTPNLRLVPRRVRSRIDPSQAILWLFVFQTLQGLGLRMTDEVDLNIIFILEALEFKHVRKVIIGVLEICDRPDLLIEFYEMEKIQLAPLLSHGNTDLLERSSSEGAVEQMAKSFPSEATGKPAEEVMKEVTEDTSSRQSFMSDKSESTIEPLVKEVTIVKSDGNEAYVSIPSHGPMPEYVYRNLGQTSFSGPEHEQLDSASTTPSHSREVSLSSSAQADLSSSSVSSPASPKEDKQGYCQAGLLRHRMYFDPARRAKLKVDPGAKHVAKMTRLQYDRLLLEDFRWAISEHLGYGLDARPSRKETHQLLQEASWDFDLAISRCISNINNEAAVSFEHSGFSRLRD